MSTKNNVSQTVRDDLCCSCGLCKSYCKQNAIEYVVNKLGFYVPKVDTDKCNNCGLCVKSCPGTNDLKNYNPQEETYCYGYSLEEEMRLNASSGGIATELLCYLVENKIVDYVTCVTNRTNNHLPQQILTNDIEQIRNARTSKYCPVSWNNIVEHINATNGTIAVIGLPCQINSLKKYYHNKKHNIKLFISLFCNHTPSLYAAEYLTKALGKDIKLKSIINRGHGFPGYMTLAIEHNSVEKNVYFPYRKIMAAGYGKFFKNRRCLVCNDPFAKNADIVLGDSYFLQDTDTKGTTLCIVRNPEIADVLKKMVEQKVIQLHDGPQKDVIEKYYKVLFDREKNFAKKNAILIKCGNGIKEFGNMSSPTVSLKDKIRFYKSVIVISLGKYHFFWGLLAKMNHVKELSKNTINDTTENNSRNRL